MQRELETIESTARTTPSPGGPVRARAKRALRLDLLERIIVAPDLRQTAQAALAAFREVVPGEHFSAILFNPQLRQVEDYFLDQAWLRADTLFWAAAQQSLLEHPLAASFLAWPQSMSLVRSRVVSDADWQKTWLYNEMERPRAVADLATICQVTSSQQVLILTCGRSGMFFDRDLAPLHSYQRVLNAVVPSCVGLAPAPAPTPGWSSVPTPSPLSRLTAREAQILGWVREGKRDPEIGLILEISPRTVNHHLANVYRKLGVETRTAAARLQ